MRRAGVALACVLLAFVADGGDAAKGGRRHTAEAIVSFTDFEVIEQARRTGQTTAPPLITLDEIKAEFLAWPSLQRLIQLLKWDTTLVVSDDWQQKYSQIRRDTEIEVLNSRPGVCHIKIRYHAADPRDAHRAANVFGDTLIEDIVGERSKQAAKRVQALQGRAQELSRKLKEWEARLAAHEVRLPWSVPRERERLQAALVDLEIKLRMGKDGVVADPGVEGRAKALRALLAASEDEVSCAELLRERDRALHAWQENMDDLARAERELRRLRDATSFRAEFVARALIPVD